MSKSVGAPDAADPIADLGPAQAGDTAEHGEVQQSSTLKQIIQRHGTNSSVTASSYRAHSSRLSKTNQKEISGTEGSSPRVPERCHGCRTRTRSPRPRSPASGVRPTHWSLRRCKRRRSAQRSQGRCGFPLSPPSTWGAWTHWDSRRDLLSRFSFFLPRSMGLGPVQVHVSQENS